MLKHETADHDLRARARVDTLKFGHEYHYKTTTYESMYTYTVKQ